MSGEEREVQFGTLPPETIQVPQNEIIRRVNSIKSFKRSLSNNNTGEPVNINEALEESDYLTAAALEDDFFATDGNKGDHISPEELETLHDNPPVHTAPIPINHDQAKLNDSSNMTEHFTSAPMSKTPDVMSHQPQPTYEPVHMNGTYFVSYIS